MRRSIPRRPDVRRDLDEGRPELENDVLAIAEQDRVGRSGISLLIDRRLDRLASPSTLAVEDRPAERLAPHRKEVAESERPLVAGLDVNDPARVMRVEPADLRRGDADVGGYRTDLTAH